MRNFGAAAEGGGEKKKLSDPHKETKSLVEEKLKENKPGAPLYPNAPHIVKAKPNLGDITKVAIVTRRALGLHTFLTLA